MVDTASLEQEAAKSASLPLAKPLFEIDPSLVSVAEWVLRWGAPETNVVVKVRLSRTTQEVACAGSQTTQLNSMTGLLHIPSEFDVKIPRLVSECEKFISDASVRASYLGLANADVNVALNILLRREGIPLIRAPVLRDHPRAWAIPDALAVRPALNWDAEWTRQDDGLLLTGVVLHGHGNWEAIAADSSLRLADKIYLGSRELIPNELVLSRRADYLIGLLVAPSGLAAIAHSLCQSTTHSETLLSSSYGVISNARHSAQTNTEPQAAFLDSQHGSAVATLPLTSPPVEAHVTKRQRERTSRVASPVKPKSVPASVPTTFEQRAQQKMPTPPRDVDIITRKWNQAAASAGAASISIVGERIPASWHRFQYLENSLDL